MDDHIGLGGELGDDRHGRLVAARRHGDIVDDQILLGVADEKDLVAPRLIDGLADLFGRRIGEVFANGAHASISASQPAARRWSGKPAKPWVV
ncbi:MAG: hypothetical protein BWY77_00978 [bacterium ADurb.Bin431]|nr:MAG: hypothetical protein BWY77_00978 [bacterium ADurb.Bin431]